MIFKFYIAFILHIKQYAHAPTPPLKNPMISTLYPEGGRTVFVMSSPVWIFPSALLLFCLSPVVPFIFFFCFWSVLVPTFQRQIEIGTWDSCTHAKQIYLRLLEMKCSSWKSKTRRFEFVSFFSKKGIEKGKQRSNNVDWRC